LTFFIKVSLPRRFIFNRVLAPEGELLSFASPKESNQRKGDPGCRLVHSAHPCASPCGCYACKPAILPICPVLLAFVEGQEGAPAPLLTCGIPAAPLNGLFSTKAPVLGAAYGTKIIRA
ncbi:MAG: hypothetical protein M0R47_17275, partial [Methylobacter sp.]|uniref:hypothetical protein n=1 Tax=Methylobacter sp. TaxID=2051955 RepID=UPI0025FE2DC1